ncbi:ankyrin [Polychaeton citri CBS 116435]|uniref:Ankyrin n=1 Tax=Polychaeton citri CBS 116435 TaxID=1314669 RepID=A0A9P4PX14_9PEZI|nr:ankyrin [Polychaeton citri CBS 116435]
MAHWLAFAFRQYQTDKTVVLVMEVVGGIASVWQLVQAVSAVIKTTRKICIRLKHAPEQLLDLETELLCTQQQLIFIQGSCEKTPDHILPEYMREILQRMIARASNNIAVIDDMSLECLKRSSLNFRVHWALQDKQKLDKALTGLHEIRTSIHGILQQIILSSQVVALSHLEKIEQRFCNVKQSQDLKNLTCKQSRFSKPRRQSARCLLSRSPNESGGTCAAVGVRYTVVSTKQGAHSDYHIALSASIPFLNVLGHYMLMVTMSIRTFPLYTFRACVESSLSVARVISKDSPFFTACTNGDVLAVRKMLVSGQGRLSDVDEDNWTPLAHAIAGGQDEIVNELIDAEVDVNASFGLRQTSPLQWALWQKQYDVVRTLLNRGASQDHVNLFGWNATFFCWARMSKNDQPMTFFLQLLSDDTYQDLDIVDGRGWTVLQRVAAYGFPCEIRELIKLGADPVQVTLPLHWGAIHHATFYGNLDTFEELVPYYQSVQDIVDERGWTLLHIAASAGQFDIMQRLLDLGANPEARTHVRREFDGHMPVSLHGRCCSVEEVAAAQNHDRGHQVSSIIDDFLSRRDIFHDAVASCRHG